MIYDARTLPSPLRLKADLCVVGSGPGGMGVAVRAAEAGLKVVVLEAGAHISPRDMNQHEEDMFPRLFWEAGTRTTHDRAVKIHQGRGVGGSSLHNLNLCKRVPRRILQEWLDTRRLEHLPLARWAALYDDMERLLEVSAVPEPLWNRHNRLLLDGASALGWTAGGLSHNRTGCVAAGFCEVGCAFDAKNNAAKILLPRALAAGAEVITHAHALRVRHDATRVSGVDAVVDGPAGPERERVIDVEASRVCLSASATRSALIALRSGLPHPPGSVGQTLRIHPAVVAAGEFDAPVNAWAGIPQTVECTQWLDLEGGDAGKRTWILPAFAHPVGTATMVPGLGPPHRAFMKRYANLAVFTAMLHDHTTGTVRTDGETGMRLDYWPDAPDRAQLVNGLWACAKLLLAAGARRVVVPASPAIVVENAAQVDALRALELRPFTTDLVAVHPMGTIPMGDDPATAAVDSRGRWHGVAGLHVADASLFPTSVGVPPQLSVYALGWHVGEDVART
ncbi:MAG: GMC family oxidoreductase [Deltaproteobacteria bacterium]|nr:GMC family oxidoreductase [Deltaproteobacteria bacterium]